MQQQNRYPRIVRAIAYLILIALGIGGVSFLGLAFAAFMDWWMNLPVN